MTEVPSTGDIRKIADLDLIDEKYQADWLEYVNKTLSGFLTAKAFELQNGEMIRYEFDSVIFGKRDKNKPNRYERIWSKRYPEIVALLIDKGYFCEADDFEKPVSLIIALEEQIWTLDAPPRKFNWDYEKTTETEKRSWWKFW